MYKTALSYQYRRSKSDTSFIVCSMGHKYEWNVWGENCVVSLMISDTPSSSLGEATCWDRHQGAEEGPVQVLWRAAGEEKDSRREGAGKETSEKPRQEGS